MQSNFNHLKHNIFLPLILFSIVSFSCVYFNTFYNAETSFKKAMKIIEVIADDSYIDSIPTLFNSTQIIIISFQAAIISNETFVSKYWFVV